MQQEPANAHQTNAHQTNAHQTNAHQTTAHQTTQHQTTQHQTTAQQTATHQMAAHQAAHRPAVGPEHGIEAVARRRLRSLRVARGWTLDELARRSLISASTISRIETGHRRLAIDNLADLARALETTVDEILGSNDDDDVVIRPKRDECNGIVHWPLTRHHDPSGRIVTKMRIGVSKKPPNPQVHPGRDWFYVLEGTARLTLGDREHLVTVGQAAEFNTMTPHAISAHGGPVEILAIFDRDGDLAHLRPIPES